MRALPGRRLSGLQFFGRAVIVDRAGGRAGDESQLRAGGHVAAPQISTAAARVNAR